jgi:hypothetical protein
MSGSGPDGAAELRGGADKVLPRYTPQWGEGHGFGLGHNRPSGGPSGRIKNRLASGLQIPPLESTRIRYRRSRRQT